MFNLTMFDPPSLTIIERKTMKLSHTLLSIAATLLLSATAIAADEHKGDNHEHKKSETHAHEAKPMYGGVVTEVKDINYELVAKPDSIALYITDHSKPIDAKGASAAVTLLSSSGKVEATLLPVGANKLEAKGAFKVGPGTKAIANVTLAGQPSQNVRFTIK
jgi:hypothetical protein